MTNAKASGPGDAEVLEGTVFDIGYQHYTGPREGRNRARLAVYKDGLRNALGLGRGGRAKILPWFFIAVAGVIGLVMALIAGAVNRYIGPDAVEQLNLPSHSDYYGIASIVFFVFAAVGAPESMRIPTIAISASTPTSLFLMAQAMCRSTFIREMCSHLRIFIPQRCAVTRSS